MTRSRSVQTSWLLRIQLWYFKVFEPIIRLLLLLIAAHGALAFVAGFIYYILLGQPIEAEEWGRNGLILGLLGGTPGAPTDSLFIKIALLVYSVVVAAASLWGYFLLKRFSQPARDFRRRSLPSGRSDESDSSPPSGAGAGQVGNGP